MKDTVNKGFRGNGSRQDAEVAAFRDLVSSYFDKSGQISDTDRCAVSAPDAAKDDLEGQGRDGVVLDSTLQMDRQTRVGSDTHLPPREVESLAANALKVLASPFDADRTARSGREAKQDAPLAQLLALTDAYIGIDEQARHDILARIMSRGISSNDVIDSVVPAAARYMGQLWAADKLSFAEVTIGAARLQETVRTIGTRKIDSPHKDPEGAAVLLVVPRIEQHTLGIFVLAEQFRRLQVRVHMTLGSNHGEILRLVRAHRFAMIGVTASSRRTLASVRDLVKTIRNGVPRITPIVVGGPVTNMDLDVVSLTGADYVANKAQEALQVCGISLAQDRRLES